MAELIEIARTTSSIGHSDRPLDRLEQDSLGLGPYAHGLAEFIRQCDTPFTVAVQGDWGTGKTSLMKMVEALLTPAGSKGEKPIKAVWFQTWQYSQFGSMAALPTSLLATLLERLSPPGRVQAVKQIMSRLVKPLAGAAVRFGTLGASELDDFEGLAARQSIDSASNADALKKEIAAVVQKQLDDGADRIIVFIDDLFDKIIQLPFTVTVARYTIDKYMAAQFRDLRLPMEEDDGELFADPSDVSARLCRDAPSCSAAGTPEQPINTSPPAPPRSPRSRPAPARTAHSSAR